MGIVVIRVIVDGRMEVLRINNFKLRAVPAEVGCLSGFRGFPQRRVPSCELERSAG